MAKIWYPLAFSLVLWSLHLCHPYDLKCPETQHFKLRAAAKCPENPKKYVCLNNTLEDRYQEKCARPDFNPEGTKVVLQPNLHKANCSKSRYQPIIFETWMNSDCIILKSGCTEEGQVVYSTGSTVADVSCTCDYTKGYTFVSTPANKCYCVPSQEDCSCYMPECKVTQDHDCEDSATSAPGYTPICKAIDQHNSAKANTSTLQVTEEYIEETSNSGPYLGIAVFILLSMMVSIWIYFIRYKVTFPPSSECKTVDAVIGNSLELSVKFSTNRTTCYTIAKWFHNNDLVRSDERRSWKVKQNNTCVLTITDVKKEDEGEYTCYLIPPCYLRLAQGSPAIHLTTKVKKLTEYISVYHFARIMIVGKLGVGKTSLAHKLCSKSIEGITSTESIDVATFRLESSNNEWKKVDDIAISNIEKQDNVSEEVQPVDIATNHTQSQSDTVEEDLKHEDEDFTEEWETDSSDPYVYTPATSLKENKPEPSMEKTDNVLEPDGYYQKDVVLHTEKEKYMPNDQPSSSNPETVNETIEIQSNPTSLEADIQNTVTKTEQKLNGIPFKDYDAIIESTTKTFLDNLPNENNMGEISKYFSLWDFAGEKEFYATHQAFLSSLALYILVTNRLDESTNGPRTTNSDLDTSTNMKSVEFFDYVQFWLDIIHCFAIKTTEADDEEDVFDPPVFVVCTKTDQWKGTKSQKDQQEQFKNRIYEMLSCHESRKHIRDICFVSNTKDDNSVFSNLRKTILEEGAEKLRYWKHQVPLKWLLFLHILKNIREKEKIARTEHLFKLAQHDKLQMKSSDLTQCLKLLHETGHVLFFDEYNIRKHVILDPKWLADAFGCIVTDKIEERIRGSNDWQNKLKATGELTDKLLEKLFNKKPEYRFKENKNHLIEVMRRFDIIIRIKTDSQPAQMYMPCMMETIEINDIQEKFNPKKISPWLCIEYEFLPPAFFNHILVRLITQYKVRKIYDEKSQSEKYALYRHLGVFHLDNVQLRYLVLCEAKNLIAVQIWNFDPSEGDFTYIKHKLLQYQRTISKRYRMEIKYDISFKCRNGDFRMDRIKRNGLTDSDYGCTEHGTHKSLDILQCWCTDLDTGMERQMSILTHIIENVAVTAVRKVFDGFFNKVSFWEEIKKKETNLKIVKMIARGEIDTNKRTLLLSKDKHISLSLEEFDINFMNKMLWCIKGLKIHQPKQQFSDNNIVKEYKSYFKKENFKTPTERDLTALNFFRILLPKEKHQPINNEMFEEYFSSLSEILSGLGGQDFKEECEQIKNKKMAEFKTTSSSRKHQVEQQKRFQQRQQE